MAIFEPHAIRILSYVAFCMKPLWNWRCGKHVRELASGATMVMKLQAQTDLVKAITSIAAAMPPARTAQLYEFALFLQSHPLPAEETVEQIASDEALWDAQFAATDNDRLSVLVASVEAEINNRVIAE